MYIKTKLNTVYCGDNYLYKWVDCKMWEITKRSILDVHFKFSLTLASFTDVRFVSCRFRWRGERRSGRPRWEKIKRDASFVSVLLRLFSPKLWGAPLFLPAVLFLAAEHSWLPAFFVLHRLPGAPPIFPQHSPSSCRSPWSGAQCFCRMASSRLLSGSVSHLSVASEERLHRSRKHGTPDVLLRVRQEAEEKEQAVSRVQAAHPVRRLHLHQLNHPRITSSISRVPSISTIRMRKGFVQQDRHYKGTTAHDSTSPMLS